MGSDLSGGPSVHQQGRDSRCDRSWTPQLADARGRAAESNRVDPTFQRDNPRGCWVGGTTETRCGDQTVLRGNEHNCGVCSRAEGAFLTLHQRANPSARAVANIYGPTVGLEL